jgi:hypothetical protein
MKDPNLTKWVSAAVTPQDKELLRRIAHIYGSSGESATMRRLIREEARRRGLLVDLPQVPRQVVQAN